MKKILLLISIAVIFGCGGDTRSFTNIVQTQTAENMIGNATATAVAEVTECTAEQGIVYDTLSESEKAKWVTECESSFTAAQAVGKDAAASAEKVAMSLTTTAEAGGEAVGSLCEKKK